jgi:hypothetical protein
MAKNERILGEFEGIYRGLNLSFDYSPVAWGEAEVIIDEQQVVLRGATGVGNSEESRDLGRAREVSSAQVLPELRTEGILTGDLRTFMIGSLILAFDLKAEENDTLALIPLNSRAVLGGLFSPQQVKRGLYTTAYRKLEAEFDTPGGFPLLSLGGYAPIDTDK